MQLGILSCQNRQLGACEIPQRSPGGVMEEFPGWPLNMTSITISIGNYND